MTAADIFLPNLGNWRSLLLQCAKAMTDEQLNWVPPGGVNSTAWCIRHLAQTEDWWVRVAILGETTGPRRTKELLDRQVALDYLSVVWAKTHACMAQWDWEYLQQPRTMPPGFPGKPPEALNVLWALVQLQEHFTFHVGQVRMMTRMQGLDPAISE